MCALRSSRSAAELKPTSIALSSGLLEDWSHPQPQLDPTLCACCPNVTQRQVCKLQHVLSTRCAQRARVAKPQSSLPQEMSLSHRPPVRPLQLPQARLLAAQAPAQVLARVPCPQDRAARAHHLPALQVLNPQAQCLCAAGSTARTVCNNLHLAGTRAGCALQATRSAGQISARMSARALQRWQCAMLIELLCHSKPCKVPSSFGSWRCPGFIATPQPWSWL